jgi:hypothetical protein
MTRVLSVAGELGREVSDGGAGDQQAERMLLLLAKTGRRVMEILQLDTTRPNQQDPLGASPPRSGAVWLGVFRHLLRSIPRFGSRPGALASVMAAHFTHGTAAMAARSPVRA